MKEKQIKSGAFPHVSRFSVISICVVNAIPLYGVQVLGWSAFFVIFTYWLENFVIGFYTVLKMCVLQGQFPFDKTLFSRASKILFFILHFGIFTAVHGMFIWALFYEPEGILLWQAFLMFVSLMASHGISYFVNFIGKHEYKKVTIGQILISPYLRIFPLHLAIIFSGAIFFSQQEPSVTALTLLVILKLGLDLILHIFERFRFEKQRLVP